MAVHERLRRIRSAFSAASKTLLDVADMSAHRRSTCFPLLFRARGSTTRSAACSAARCRRPRLRRPRAALPYNRTRARSSTRARTLCAREIAARHGYELDLVGGVRAGNDLLQLLVERIPHLTAAPTPLPSWGSAVSRMRWLRGLVGAEENDVGDVVGGHPATSCVRPRPVRARMRGEAPPPGQTFVHRMCSRSSWSSARVKPTWANFEEQ